MKVLDDATRRQLEAADPKRSTWLSANAGSGKTRVLTDRVARLLLNGVQPQRILCLTYTKAAASEMQNRLFKRLGAWAMLDDNALSEALLELGLGTKPTALELRDARTLFARAIETPGGLKIQTIHSFCGGLLRRFPLEAGVSPQFTEIEGRAAALLRDEIVEAMAAGNSAHLLKNVAHYFTDTSLTGLTQSLVSKARLFDAPFSRSTVLTDLGHPPDLMVADVERDVLAGLQMSDITDMIAAYASGSSTDQKKAAALQQVTSLDDTAFPHLERALLTKSGTIPARIATKAVTEAHPAVVEMVSDLAERLVEGRDARHALLTVERTQTLCAFAAEFLKRYTDAKAARGWLDFDDLIEKARALLSDSRMAAWVLFRIDGGIDHILVDEAQDTSPSQWDVVRKLSEEFASGEGARSDVERTIFVVGDQKQSIYSFQGADPEAFDTMRQEFDERLRHGLQQTSLDYSFRSSSAILRLVDTVFEDPGMSFARSEHLAFRDRMPGRVDVWPVIPPHEKAEDGAWYDPVDRKSDTHHHKQMARAVADALTAMLDPDTQAVLPTEGGVRAVEPRDILILVRKRTGLFPDLIQACKDAGLPIAGADRLKVGAEMAVKDLGALLNFLATPDDDLSLATALRSPLFGWSESELFELAHNRGQQRLWQALRSQTETHSQTINVLRDLRERVDYLRPYDLIERMLTRHEGRKKLLGRLGTEAEDGIDALLSQALSYESGNVPSLTGFLVWMETDDLVIKRQIDSASNQIRIMTVHGAKGLEAPIVVLPECGVSQSRNTATITDINGQAIWLPKADERPRVVQDRMSEIATAQQEESLRLLYVALTRAEQWLIVGASGKVDEKNQADWYHRVLNAATTMGASPLETSIGTGGRYEVGNWLQKATQLPAQSAGASQTLPAYFSTPAPVPQPPPKTIAPSSLTGPKSLPGEGMEMAEALAYGTLVHGLLEQLPFLAGDARQSFIAREVQKSKLDAVLADAALRETEAVIAAPNLAPLFSPDTLAEVPITAILHGERMFGTIDRLLVTPEKITAIDFKTNRIAPQDPAQTPEGLLKQMAAYSAALAQIYPDRIIETAILWTAKPMLMHIPHEIVSSIAADPRYLDVDAGQT